MSFIAPVTGFEHDQDRQDKCWADGEPFDIVGWGHSRRVTPVCNQLSVCPIGLCAKHHKEVCIGESSG